MKTRLLTLAVLLGLTAGGLVSTSSAHAQQFLVGAYLFAANTSGVTSTVLYQYDTNNTDAASILSINGLTKNISIAVPSGSTVFTFDQTLNTGLFPTGTNGDLGLFFSTTNTPYNSTTPRTPDLLVSRNTDGLTSFFTPATGTAINTYFYSNGGSTIAANGATSFVVGTSTIAVTAYSVANKPSGSFTLTVTPLATTPEPGSVALLVGLGLSGSAFALRRRRK